MTNKFILDTLLGLSPCTLPTDCDVESTMKKAVVDKFMSLTPTAVTSSNSVYTFDIPWREDIVQSRERATTKLIALIKNIEDNYPPPKETNVSGIEDIYK